MLPRFFLTIQNATYFRTETIPYINLTKEYILSFYWSALTLTTLGEQVPTKIITNTRICRKLLVL